MSNNTSCHKIWDIINLFEIGSIVSRILPDLPEGFITAAFDRLLPENREKLGPVFLCIQDFRKIAATAAELVIRQLSGTDEPARIITIPPAEFLRF